MRLAYCIAPSLVVLAAASVSLAGGLPSYTQPGSATSQPSAVEKLTAREITTRLFKATPGSPPNLESVNLTLLDLAELDFKGADLDGADLYGADLSRANLKGASLVGVRLDRAVITSTDFSGADLTDTRIFRPTIFTSLEVMTSEAPKFVGAKLVRMRSDGMLERADFTDADLTDAILGRFAVREASVNARASLQGANFTRAILKNAKLSGTSLRYARFMDADLSGAKFQGSDLLKADFTGANLAGADFTGANMDEADLRGAHGLSHAIGLTSARNYDRALVSSVP